MDIKEELEDEPISATRFEECFVSGVPEDYQTDSLDQEPTKDQLTCDSTPFSGKNIENQDGLYPHYKSEIEASSNLKGHASLAQSFSYCKSFPEQASGESEAVFFGDSDYNADLHEGLLAAQSNDDYRSEDGTENNENNSLFMAPSLTDASPKDFYIICGDNDPVIFSGPQAATNVLATDSKETLILPSEKISKKVSIRKRQRKQKNKKIIDNSGALGADDDELREVGSEEQISALVSPSSSTQIPLDSTRSKRRRRKSVVRQDVDGRVNQTSTEFEYGESNLIAVENESGVVVDSSVTIMTDNNELWVVENEGQIRALNLPSSEIQSPSKRLKLKKRGVNSVHKINLSEEMNRRSMENESSVAECEQISTLPPLAENTWIMCISSPEVGELDNQVVSVTDLPTAESVVNDFNNEISKIDSDMITNVDDGCFFIGEPLKIDGEEQMMAYKLDSVENEWPEPAVTLEETINLPAMARVNMFGEKEALEELTVVNNGSDSENEVILVNWEEVIEVPSNPRKPLIMCRPISRDIEEGGRVNQLLSINKAEGTDENDCSQATKLVKPRRRKQSLVYKSDSVEETDVTIIGSDGAINVLLDGATEMTKLQTRKQSMVYKSDSAKESDVAIIDSDDDIEMIANKGESETDTDDETDILFDNSGVTCNICRKTFDSSLLVRVHKKTHHSTKSYQCLECEVTFYSEFGLECHLCEQGDRFVCKRCERVFPSEWSAVSHKCVCDEHVQTQTRAACKICGLNVTRRLLNRHITEYHADVLAKWNVTDLEKDCGDLQSEDERSD